MQYMLLICGNEAAAAKMTPAVGQQVMGAYFAYTEAMRKAGVYKDGNPLQQTSTASTVRMKNGKSIVLDGPYAESKEQIGGYYVIDVANLDEALSWAAKCPAVAHGGGVEVRPIMAAAASLPQINNIYCMKLSYD